MLLPCGSSACQVHTSVEHCSVKMLGSKHMRRQSNCLQPKSTADIILEEQEILWVL